MTPKQEQVIRELREAALNMDWQQVVLNGGPPCFHLCDDKKFCGRAKRWQGHDDMHKFVPLDTLILIFEQAQREKDNIIVPLRKERDNLQHRWAEAGAYLEAHERQRERLLDERDRLQEQLEQSFKGVLFIRCGKHLSIPQQNRNEYNGGECGGCIAKQRDEALLDKVAKLEACCAEMRTALLSAQCRYRKEFADLDKLDEVPSPYDDALSTTCGQSLLDELVSVKRERDEARELLLEERRTLISYGFQRPNTYER